MQESATSEIHFLLRKSHDKKGKAALLGESLSYAQFESTATHNQINRMMIGIRLEELKLTAIGFCQKILK